jgi:hypothetical protein
VKFNKEEEEDGDDDDDDVKAVADKAPTILFEVCISKYEC